MRLLIIEDSSTMTEVIKNRLLSLGIDDVDTLRDLPKDGDEEYECILCDLGLLTSSGIDTIIRLRKIYRYTPIVVLTQVEDPEIHAGVILAGASSVYLKGCRAKDILTAIKTAVLVEKKILNRACTLIRKADKSLSEIYSED